MEKFVTISVKTNIHEKRAGIKFSKDTKHRRGGSTLCLEGRKGGVRQ